MPSMPQRTTNRIFILFAIALVSATITLAQSATSPEIVTIPTRGSHSWQYAQLFGSSKHKLYVVTMDQPQRRQTCHVQSFTAGKLVCSRAFGDPRTYLPQQLVAIILPGDDALRLCVWLGLNAGLGAAIWGTVVLAATCPACAVATGIAALVLFSAAGAVAYGDDVPHRLLYLAPRQELSRKLGYVHD